MSAEALSVSLCLPLAWQAGLPADPLAAGQAAMRALATAVSLAERPAALNEELVGLELEVARLHQKTQLLTELLALALSRDGSRPEAIELHLSGGDCVWRSTRPVAADTEGTLSLWLHPATPEPLRWPARIERVQGDGLVRAVLLPLGEAPQAALERQVFQLHRRAVAEAVG